MTRKETAPEAHTFAEEQIELDVIVANAVDEATNVNDAQDLAHDLTEQEVFDELEGTDEHLIDDVAADLGWRAAKDAKSEYIKQNVKSEYIKQNVEEFK